MCGYVSKIWHVSIACQVYNSLDKWCYPFYWGSCPQGYSEEGRYGSGIFACASADDVERLSLPCMSRDLDRLLWLSGNVVSVCVFVLPSWVYTYICPPGALPWVCVCACVRVYVCACLFVCVIEAERGWKARSHEASNKAHPSNPCDLSDILSAPLQCSHYVDRTVVSVICLFSICILSPLLWLQAHALFWLIYSPCSEIFMHCELRGQSL